MEFFAIIACMLLIVGGIVLGCYFRNGGSDTSTNDDIQTYVFNNAFMNQIHDYFEDNK